MSLREQLEAIYAEHHRLDPQVVVDAARPKSHPLHGRFEWNNAVAGEAWRRVQAHELIRSVRVVYREASDSGPEASVRAFHAVRREDGHVYESAETVAHDPLLRAMVLRDMERQWQELKRRYGDFAEFIDMVREDLHASIA